MMMQVNFTVLGEPKGKGRPRLGRYGTYTPENTAIYENLIAVEYLRQVGRQKFADGAEIAIRILAYFGIAKSVSQKKRALMLEEKIRPTKRPDCDNITKAVLDALNGVAYHDDAQIVDLMFRKYYSDTPRLEILIYDIGGLNE